MGSKVFVKMSAKLSGMLNERELISVLTELDSERIDTNFQNIIDGFESKTADSDNENFYICLHKVLLCVRQRNRDELSDFNLSVCCEKLVDKLIRNLQVHNVVSEFDSVYSILEQCLELSREDYFTRISLRLAQKVESDLSNFEQRCPSTNQHVVAIQILQRILNVIIRKTNATDIHYEKHVERLLKILKDTHFHSILIKLCVFCHSNTEVPVFSSLFSKIVTVTKSYHLLVELRNKVLQLYYYHKSVNNELEHLTKCLFMLCAYAEFFISPLHKKCTVLFNNEFWFTIQKGLTHSDPLLRKESLYLLKRSVDTVHKTNWEVETDLFFYNFVHFKECIEFWELLFLILEALEEKQVHLITPVLPSVVKIEKLVAKSNNKRKINPSWLLCVFQRIFKHDSNQIVKWGILKFLQLKIDFYESDCEHILWHLIESLNNSHLFTNLSENGPGISEVETELEKWFQRICRHPHCRDTIMHTVLTSITTVHWNPVPLFYVLKCMSESLVTPLWQDQSLLLLQKFVSTSIGTQNVYIRSANQCCIINSVIRFTDANIKLETVIHLLGSFRRNESLKRGTATWNNVVEWLKVVKDKNDLHLIFEKYVKQSHGNSNDGIFFSSETIARIIVLFYDAKLIFNYGDRDCFKPINDYLQCLFHASIMVYPNIDKINSCIQLIINILQESECSGEDDEVNPFIEILKESLVETMRFINRRFIEIKEIAEFDSVRLYLRFLKCLGRTDHSSLIIKFFIQQFLKFTSTASLSPSLPPISKYFYVNVVKWVAELVLSNKSKNVDTNALSILLKDFIVNVIKSKQLSRELIKNDNDPSCLHSTQNLWGRVVSGYLQSLWSVLSNCILIYNWKIDNILVYISLSDFYNDALESLEKGGREIIVDVLNVAQLFLPRILHQFNVDLAKNFVSVSWQACFELRKMELFWPAIQKWIQMVYQLEVIADEANHPILLDYAKKIFEHGESLNGLCNILLIQLQKEVTKTRLLVRLQDVLVSALLFGPMRRKDQRIENDTVLYIKSLGPKFSVNTLCFENIKDDGEVRMRAFSSVLNAVSEDNDMSLIINITSELMDKYKQLTLSKQRYYGDSHHHRYKNRILQALLVFESVLVQSNTDEAEICLLELAKWTCSCLQGESQQPSVRYQLEWLLTCIIIHKIQLIPCFWDMFHQASEERLGSICSFISITYHLAAVLKDDDFIYKSVEEILPWCMAQNFNIRLYAQVVLEKLWPLSARVSSQYTVIQKSLQTSLAQGNAVKNAVKLQQDFYFSAFHPIKHFSLQTIFFDLPRLANLTYEEWVPASVLERCFVGFMHHYLKELKLAVPVCNSDDLLTQCSAPSWVVKVTESESQQIDAATLQKKFVPWKDMESMHVTEANDGLVVVASLIDKTPNLGGLSRTCEVFAVSSLVLGSLDYTTDKQFVTLSMSAEKHINITEVKPHNLPEYLTLMKKSGYTLVGAEQTAASISLSAFPFPKKCLLLLGNEKEGVPVNLLPLLDVCVEIPQHGVVRSLNVHVTGAIFIWEYAKQHKLKDGNNRT